MKKGYRKCKKCEIVRNLEIVKQCPICKAGWQPERKLSYGIRIKMPKKKAVHNWLLTNGYDLIV